MAWLAAALLVLPMLVVLFVCAARLLVAYLTQD